VPVRALRGATTVDRDEPEHISERVRALIEELWARNDVQHDDLISILFTATSDIHSMYPPAAARALGLGDVPLIGAQEIDVPTGTKLCIRVMVHLETTKSRTELRHVYLEGARGLRDDLPG
jgi:chorismate mutase